MNEEKLLSLTKDGLSVNPPGRMYVRKTEGYASDLCIEIYGQIPRLVIPMEFVSVLVRDMHAAVGKYFLEERERIATENGEGGVM